MDLNLPRRLSSMTPEFLKEMGFEGESIAMQAASELCSELHNLEERLGRGEITVEGKRLLVQQVEERSKNIWGCYAPETWLLAHGTDSP